MQFTGNYLQLLHIDSDKNLLKETKKAFNSLNPRIKISSYENPKKALKSLEKKKYDCIISEIYFKKFNGIELIKEILQKKKIPLIVYTTSVTDQIAEELYEIGVTDIYKKENCPLAFRNISNKVMHAVEKHRTEEYLVVSNARFKTIVENAPDTIITVSPLGKVTSITSNIEEKTGYKPEYFIGKHFTRIKTLTPRDFPKFLKILKSIFEGKKPESTEFEYKKTDGTIGWGEANLAMIETGKGRKELLIIAREISERKSFEHTLIDSNRDLEQLVEVRTQRLLDSERLAAAGRIAGLIAHDLRGPLQNIKAGLFLLNQNPADVDAYRMIDEASDLVSRMLQEIRDHTSESPLILVPTEIGQFTRKTIDVMLPPENIEIVLDLKKDYTIPIDPNKMKRVLENLISNAIEAMPAGGKVTVGIQRLGETTQIQVIDNGVGVREEDKRNLFKAFNTTKSNGMGLGLVYCKQAVEAHHGTISFESKIGRGTTVTIHLPHSMKSPEVRVRENISSLTGKDIITR